MGTSISWATEVWNAVTGCTKLLADCDHCYAEALSRKRGWSQHPWDKAHEGENIVLHPERLDKPRHWWRPRRIFVNSMSDAFHPRIPEDLTFRAFDIMCEVDRHVYLILTKRPQRVRPVVERYLASRGLARLPAHIWIGTSLGIRAARFRLDQLREAAAIVPSLWVSFEPLLEDLGDLDLTGIGWVVVGGESGQGFRPMDHAWARAIRDQCVARGIPFFFKQSAAPRTEMGTALIETDGTQREWRQVPASWGTHSLPTGHSARRRKRTR